MSPRFARRFALWLPALLVGLMVAGEAFGCPTCKAALDGEDGQGTAQATGYAWSIAFMMAMPFTLLGTAGFMGRRMYLQSLAEAEAAEAAEQPVESEEAASTAEAEAPEPALTA